MPWSGGVIPPGQKTGLARLKRYYHAIARTRARGKHVFQTLKFQLRCRRTHYCGLIYNEVRTHTLVVQANSLSAA